MCVSAHVRACVRACAAACGVNLLRGMYIVHGSHSQLVNWLLSWLGQEVSSSGFGKSLVRQFKAHNSMRVHLYVSESVNACVCKQMFPLMHTYVSAYVCVCACMHECLNVRVHVCAYVCAYVCDGIYANNY